MRIKLHIEKCNSKDFRLPIYYQDQIHNWIENLFNCYDSPVRDWLCENNYINSDSDYNLYTFSRILIREYAVDGTSLIMTSPNGVITLSVYPPAIPESHLIELLNEQTFSIKGMVSNTEFKVNSIEKVNQIKIKGEMIFRTLAPIYLSWRNPRTGDIEDIHPDHKDYEHIFFEQLINKMQAHLPEGKEEDAPLDDCFLHILTEPKPVFCSTKDPSEPKIKAYKFNFAIKASRKMIIAGYYGGFGMRNNEGLGITEVTSREQVFNIEE